MAVANVSAQVTAEYLDNKLRIERDAAQHAFVQHTEEIQGGLQRLEKRLAQLAPNRSGFNSNGRNSGNQNGYNSGGQNRNQQQDRDRNNRNNQQGFRRPRRGDPDYNMCFTCGKEHFPFCSMRKRDGEQPAMVNEAARPARRPAEEKVLTFAALDPRVSELPTFIEPSPLEWSTTTPEETDDSSMVNLGEFSSDSEKPEEGPKSRLLPSIIRLLKSLVVAWTLIALVTAIPACGAASVLPSEVTPTMDMENVTGTPLEMVSSTTQSTSWYPHLYSKVTRAALPPPSTEDEAPLRYVYRKFANTIFAKRTRDARGKYTTARLSREAKREAQAPPHLSSLYESKASAGSNC